jgi:hypothetical protein
MKRPLLVLAMAAAAGCTSDPNAPSDVALSVSPASQDFVDVAVGASSDHVTFAVRNTGRAASGHVSVTLGGPDAGQFAIIADHCAGAGSLAAGAHCDVTAAFSPSGSPGARNASLNVQGAAGGSAAATLSGTVLPVAATVSAAPATHNFGYGGSFDFTITNSGAGATGPLSFHITGAFSDDFAVTVNSCTTSLGPGASCIVTVVFYGADIGGNESAWLNVIDPDGAAVPTHLTGTGI